MQAPPPRTAVEWAEANRVLPPGSPEPGKFRYSRTPYMRPLARAFANPSYSRVTCVTGTQMGKSATFFNVIGWRVDDDPAPVIYIGPTQSNIDKVVEPKIKEMIQECESLERKLKKEKGETSKHRKNIGGVSLRLAWAGSATELASDSAALTLVDEIDRPDDNATGEGSLEEIAEARGDAYADSKVGYTSTPTEGKTEAYRHPKTGYEHWAVVDPKKIHSPVWRLWQNGTRHEWFWPCPHCDEYFAPKSHLLWWPGKGEDSDVSPSTAAKKALLTCSHCGEGIENKHRMTMNAKGVAVAPGEYVNPKTGEIEGIADTADNNAFSYLISGMCSFSAKKSFSFLAKKMIEAEQSGDPGKLMAVHNTGFGEIYSVAGDVPEWEEVHNLRSSNYAIGELPPGIQWLICSVDVQKNRLYYVVRGWLPGMSSRLIEYGEIWGDTDKPEVWQELDELFDREWGGLYLNLMGVDCGYRTDEVLAFVRRHKGKARALMGFKRLTKPFRMSLVEVNKRGKVRKHGDKRWDFDTHIAKSWVHGRVRWPVGKVGDWLLPSDVTEEYCRHIVAEEYNESTGEWNKIAERNDYLDCEGMNYMCARMLRIDRKKVSDQDGEPVSDQDSDDEEVVDTDEPIKRKPVKRRRKLRRRGSGFTSRAKTSR